MCIAVIVALVIADKHFKPGEDLKKKKPRMTKSVLPVDFRMCFHSDKRKLATVMWDILKNAIVSPFFLSLALSSTDTYI